jgi:hypothetical protein
MNTPGAAILSQSMILTQAVRLALKTSDESQRLAKPFEESLRWDAMAASVLAISVPLFFLGINYVVAWDGARFCAT